ANPSEMATYDYGPVPPDVLERVRRLDGRCSAMGIGLPAAALAFARAHPAVTTVLLGARSAGEVRADVAYAAATVPAAVWTEP
ncbi:MAG: aldo/keto reductase, partial [Acidimicrobiales bacterium]